MDKQTTNSKSENKNQTSVHSIFRLLHFIIDSMAWLTLYLLIGYLLDQYLVRFNSYYANYIYSITLAFLVYLLYYCLLEYYFQKTLGKLVTRTQVVSLNHDYIPFWVILKRNLFRCIPIDIFFYLFSRNGLHDRLSNTQVVRIIKPL